MIDAPPSMPSEQAIVRDLVACGLDRRGVSVVWRDELQGIGVTIGPAAHASTARFPCIRNAAADQVVTFADPALQSAYDTYIAALYQPRMIADAKATVTRMGLIDGFPRRAAYRDLRDYTDAIERHCGVTPGSVLHVSGDAVTFDPPRDADPSVVMRRYEPLFAAVAYAWAIGDLKNFGFIGNAAAAGGRR